MSYLWFAIAATLEISGCFLFWLWLRMGRSAWLALPALVILGLFASALTRVDASFAGRAFAAYAGIYVIASVTWLMISERVRPTLFDLLGSALCLAGTIVIMSQR
ncbi:MAG TPA: YnfA family protein [Thermoanaerobaculia bacterium]|nr:YnfA family protein [Thermoanaerobaculia bacterium]